MRTVPFLLNTLYRRGVYSSVCSTAEPHYGHGPVGLWVTLFIFSKVRTWYLLEIATIIALLTRHICT